MFSHIFHCFSVYCIIDKLIHQHQALQTDLSKAFNCIPGNLLVVHVHDYGVDVPSLKLLHLHLCSKTKSVIERCTRFLIWNYIQVSARLHNIKAWKSYNYSCKLCKMYFLKLVAYKLLIRLCSQKLLSMFL